jgi:hypothetical protein
MRRALLTAVAGLDLGEPRLEPRLGRVDLLLQSLGHRGKGQQQELDRYREGDDGHARAARDRRQGAQEPEEAQAQGPEPRPEPR